MSLISNIDFDWLFFVKFEIKVSFSNIMDKNDPFPETNPVNPLNASVFT